MARFEEGIVKRHAITAYFLVVAAIAIDCVFAPTATAHGQDPARVPQLPPDSVTAAKDLRRAGQAGSLANAQFPVARRNGFASRPKLKTHVESLQTVGQLKQAIDSNDLERVRQLMTRHPEPHRAPLGYGKKGPLTWVAECRVPREAPGEARLAMARWMIENGSDGHQGGDGPLMRTELSDMRIPMMELPVAHGADVNALWNGSYPIICAPLQADGAVGHAGAVIAGGADHYG
jgi:hypothetical protein